MPAKDLAVWQIGFRPFFLGAAFWAAASMLVWLGIVDLGWSFNLNGLPPIYWHAHEMVFGYCLAVIAGFLLTAVPNWTNSPPVSGLLLFSIFACWFTARLSSVFAGNAGMVFTAFADLAFSFGLMVAIATPIIKRKQYRQAGILIKILLMALANLAFYLGAAGQLENGIHYGLYAAFYLIVALILTIARRVFPMFIQNGLRLSEPLRNRRWVDISSIIVFLVFWILEILRLSPVASAWVALVLLIIHSFRLYDWYAPTMWSKPLVWVLYVAYASIVLGFALKAANLVGVMIAPILVLHMFAIGGVGLLTCGMMSRVTLGHTGRNVRQPTPWLTAVFVGIAISALCRVVLPIAAPQYYLLSVTLSKLFWIAGFSGFLFLYTPMLIKPRI